MALRSFSPAEWNMLDLTLKMKEEERGGGGEIMRERERTKEEGER